MLKHGRAVTRQMLSEPDGAPLGLAEQSGEASLALDQRQVAQVVNLIWNYGLTEGKVHPFRSRWRPINKCLARVRK